MKDNQNLHITWFCLSKNSSAIRVKGVFFKQMILVTNRYFIVKTQADSFIIYENYFLFKMH